MHRERVRVDSVSFEAPEGSVVAFFLEVAAWFKCECYTCILLLSDKKPHEV